MLTVSFTLTGASHHLVCDRLGGLSYRAHRVQRGSLRGQHSHVAPVPLHLCLQGMVAAAHGVPLPSHALQLHCQAILRTTAGRPLCLQHSAPSEKLITRLWSMAYRNGTSRGGHQVT